MPGASGFPLFVKSNISLLPGFRCPGHAFGRAQHPALLQRERDLPDGGLKKNDLVGARWCGSSASMAMRDNESHSITLFVSTGSCLCLALEAFCLHSFGLGLRGVLFWRLGVLDETMST